MLADASNFQVVDLLFYTTDGCHLCEDAEAMLLQLLSLRPGQCTIEVIDIIEDDALVNQYGERIPVVRHAGSGQELGWPFDYSALEQLVLRSAEAG